MSSKGQKVAQNRGTKQQKGPKMQPRRWDTITVLIVLGGCIVVALIVFFGVQLLTQQSANNSANTSSGTGLSNNNNAPPNATGTLPSNKGTSSGYSAEFLATLKSHIAQGLHLSVDQVTNQLEGGKQISDVASEQGVSSSQLNTIEINAYQAAFDQAVQEGTYTQAQADSYMQNYRRQDPNRMNVNITQLFGGTPILSGTPQGG